MDIKEAVKDTLQFVYNSGYERAKRDLPIDTKQSIFVERETRILIDEHLQTLIDFYKKVESVDMPKKKEVEEIIRKFNKDYWERGGVEESEIVPSRIIKELAEAIDDSHKEDL